jgi:hypothetical protein
MKKKILFVSGSILTTAGVITALYTQLDTLGGFCFGLGASLFIISFSLKKSSPNLAG